jgi:hypothetical protein
MKHFAASTFSNQSPHESQVHSNETREKLKQTKKLNKLDEAFYFMPGEGQ